MSNFKGVAIAAVVI